MPSCTPPARRRRPRCFSSLDSLRACLSHVAAAKFSSRLRIVLTRKYPCSELESSRCGARRPRRVTACQWPGRAAGNPGPPGRRRASGTPESYSFRLTGIPGHVHWHRDTGGGTGGNEEAVALSSTVQNSGRSGIAADQMLCTLVRVVGRNHVPTARQWA